MHKITTIVFILLLMLLTTPVNAGSDFQYTRLIQTDNFKGYKSVVLDKAVYAHSDHFDDLRVINDKGEELPYILTSFLDASSETEIKSFVLTQEVQFSTTQDGTDSIITIQVDHLNAFRLELNAEEVNARTYGLFGLIDTSTHYLSEGELFTSLHSDSSVKKDIEWINNPSIDKLRLIIHNREGKPIKLKSVTVYYHLSKLLFKDPGNSQLWLAYGNDTLRSPIYEGLNYKALSKSESVTQTELGMEVKKAISTDTPQTPTKYKLVLISILTVIVLLMLFGVWTLLKNKNK